MAESATNARPRKEKTYAELLDAFGAMKRPANECVAFLESLGFTRGQARNAVYRYRKERKADNE
jgi:hypothetical protein